MLGFFKTWSKLYRQMHGRRVIDDNICSTIVADANPSAKTPEWFQRRKRSLVDSYQLTKAHQRLLAQQETLSGPILMSVFECLIRDQPGIHDGTMLECLSELRDYERTLTNKNNIELILGVDFSKTPFMDLWLLMVAFEDIHPVIYLKYAHIFLLEDEAYRKQLKGNMGVIVPTVEETSRNQPARLAWYSVKKNTLEKIKTFTYE